MDQALLTLEPDKTVAFVAHADLDSVRVAMMVRLDGGWSFAGYVDKEYSGDLTAGVEVRFSR